MTIQANQIHCFDPATLHGKHSPRTASQAHRLNAGDSAQACIFEHDDQMDTPAVRKADEMGEQGRSFVMPSQLLHRCAPCGGSGESTTAAAMTSLSQVLFLGPSLGLLAVSNLTLGFGPQNSHGRGARRTCDALHGPVEHSVR